MKSRWMIVSALLVMCTLALAGAATTTSSSSATAPTVAAAPSPAPDPYVGASTISTSAPAERVSCSIYAQTCKFDGGPCGPVPNTCYCAFLPTGWACGR